MKKKIICMVLLCVLALGLMVSMSSSAYAGVKTPSGCIFTLVK